MSKIKRSVLVVLAMILVSTLSVMVTLALLTAQTDIVSNTFTVGKLFDNANDFTLLEHEVGQNANGQFTTGANTVKSNTYSDIMPNQDLPKDPTVTVINLKAPAYFYIAVLNELNSTDFTVSVDPNQWAALMDGGQQITKTMDGKTYLIYYYNGASATNGLVSASKASPAGFSANVLTDNKVTVKNVNSFTSTTDGLLKLKAFACQVAGFDTPLEAWNDALK